MGRVRREARHEKSLNDLVEESYGFLIERLRGEPEEKDLDRLLLWIQTGSQDPEGDNPNQEEYHLNEFIRISAPHEKTAPRLKMNMNLYLFLMRARSGNATAA